MVRLGELAFATRNTRCRPKATTSPSLLRTAFDVNWHRVVGFAGLLSLWLTNDLGVRAVPEVLDLFSICSGAGISKVLKHSLSFRYKPEPHMSGGLRKARILILVQHKGSIPRSCMCV